MAFFLRLSGWLDWLFRAAIGILLLAATVLVFADVLLRYVFSYGLSWADELTQYMLLWMVFLGSGIAARQGAHISMEALLTALPGRIQRVNAVAVNAVCAALSAIVGFLGWGLAMAIRELGQFGPASGVPVARLMLMTSCSLVTLTASAPTRPRTPPLMGKFK